MAPGSGKAGRLTPRNGHAVDQVASAIDNAAVIRLPRRETCAKLLHVSGTEATMAGEAATTFEFGGSTA
jgi:hypothetical protein